MSKTICHCFNVTEEDIIKAVKGGATTVAAVQEETNAGNGCGSCVEAITKVVEANI